MHFTSIIKGLDILSSINLLVFAFVVGLLLQALLIKFKSIVLVSVIHCLIDFFGTMRRSLFKIENTDISDTNNALTIVSNVFLLVVFSSIILIPVIIFLRKRKLDYLEKA
jgi:hypothetical protein